MKEIVKYTAVALWLAAGAAACDKVPLLAPTNSTISLSASTRVLPLNGSTQLTAFVTESSGTSVQNGTTVRFTTTLGSVQPAEVQTRNGSVTAMFFAGTSSGVAEVRALSGAAGGGATGTGTGTGTGTTTTTTAQNVVQITIGTAAVNTVTLRANPSTVGPTGGQVELIATVVAENGNGLESILVTFNSDQGSLSSPTGTTDSSGQARTTLTTAQKASVTATAGTKTSNAVIVDVRAGPGVAIACAPAGTGTNCAAVQASASANTATVVFTVSKGTGTSNLRDTTIDFGDGITQGLGTLAGGSATVTHTYNGPGGSSPRTYTATIRATDVNGEATSAFTNVTITPRAALTIDLAADTSAAVVVNVGKAVAFTATISGGDSQSFSWDFGDGNTATTASTKTSHVYRGNGQFTATVTVTTTDGRTATGRVEFIISGI